MIGAGHYVLAAVALVVSLLTVLSMARLWEEAFCKPAPTPVSSSMAPPRLGVPILAPIAFLVTLTLGLTVMAGPVSRLTMQAAEQLLDANHYVERFSERGFSVLLGNMLLALAWAALQGECSLRTLLTGQVLGYFILVALVRGGVLRRSPYIGRVHCVVGLAADFFWELIRANLRLALDVATPRYHGSLHTLSRERRREVA